jgi:hypothetical protein
LALGWGLAVAFGIAAAIQRLELAHAHWPWHWRFELGNLAEWAAALATLGGLGALLYLRREWRSSQAERRALESERQKADKERRDLAAAREAERRDHELSQARLIIVEHTPFESRSWGGDDPPNSAHRDAVIRNYSDAPIFHLHIHEHLTANDDVYVFEQFAHQTSRPEDRAVLKPDETTGVLTINGNQGKVPSTEFVEFTFTDSRGARWRRVGSSQPVQLIDPNLEGQP